MTMRWVFTAFVILSSAPCFAAIDTIIPVPKEIRALGEPVPLDGFRIVAAGDERSQIGAAEINQRIALLGGQTLPVKPLDGRLLEGKCIVVAPCTVKELAAVTPPLEVTPANPGQQAYVIQSVGSGENLKLLLVGSDSLGTLYAAVTFRQLIIQQEGRCALRAAHLRRAGLPVLVRRASRSTPRARLCREHQPSLHLLSRRSAGSDEN